MFPLTIQTRMNIFLNLSVVSSTFGSLSDAFSLDINHPLKDSIAQASACAIELSWGWLAVFKTIVRADARTICIIGGII